jgi:ribosomal protein S18 acetylase RimI-like enzyme
MSDNAPVTIRAIKPQDVEPCGRAAYAAHTAVAAAHNVLCEHPSVEFSIGLVGNKAKDPNAVGFVAEQAGNPFGSAFLNIFPGTPVAAIGPLTVDPKGGEGAGRRLMQSTLEDARKRGIEQVRLIQSPSHLRSLALYSKLGFDVREPLVLVTGKPTGEQMSGCHVRPATVGDIETCNQLCVTAHGFSRGFELRGAIEQKTASVVQRDGSLSGYSTGLGFRGHAVANTTDDLKALIASAPAVLGPGFFVPIRNGDLLRWLFDSGFRASWPAALMTIGPYRQPATAFLPSIAF